MSNSIALITGSTGGIGTQICKYLLSQNFIVYAPIRDLNKGESLIKLLRDTYNISTENLIFIKTDLELIESIEYCIGSIIRLLGQNKIDIIINNAGIIAPKFALSKDGYERSLQVNYIAPTLFINKLIPYLGKKAKIINTLSCTIKIAQLEQPYSDLGNAFDSSKSKEFISLKNYSQSKLRLALYTKDLANKFKDNKDILVCGVDPGIVNTGIITQHRWYDPLANIFFRPFIKSPKRGAIPSIKAIECSNYTINKKFINNNLLPIFKGTKIISI